MTRARWAVVLVGALMVLVFGSVSMGQASTLSLVSAPRPFADTMAACGGGTLTVTPSGAAVSGTYTQVTVSGITGSCTQGRVIVATATGTVVLNATAAISGSTFSATTSTPFTPPSTAAASAFVSLDTWPMAASWVYAPPAGPVVAGTGATLTGSGVTWTDVRVGRQVCFTATVTGTSTAAQAWSLDLNVNQRPFNGDAVASDYSIDGNRYAWVSPTAVGGVLRLTGKAGTPYATITSASTYTISICNYETPPPTYDPALTYTVTSGPVTGSVHFACMVTTVSVTGSPQFFAGWRADIDVQPLQARILSGGRTPGAVQVTTGGVSIAPLGGTLYRATPTGYATVGVRDGSPQTVELCMSSS